MITPVRFISTYMFNKFIELVVDRIQRAFQALIFSIKIFMPGECFIGNIAILCGSLCRDFPVVSLDGLFKIVNVDELNVELIVEVFDFKQNFAVSLFARNLPEESFVIGKFFAKGTQKVSPQIAFPRQLADFCSCYHGRKI